MSDEQRRLAHYFLGAAKNIFRAPEGCLRHPYLVPGGLYANQLWDWDSYWMVKGLRAAAEHAGDDFREILTRHALGSWKNLMENQTANGAIPLLLEPQRPDVFDCARADGTHNQAKPVLAQFALELADMTGDFQWLAPYFDGLTRFLARWQTVYDGNGTGLIVWGSDLADGTDNDPAIFGRPEFASAGLLLNCFFAADLAAAAEIARRLGRGDDATRLEAQARRVGESIRRECWDPIDAFFYTVDVQCRDQRDRYIPADFPRGMDMTWRSLPLKLKGSSGFAPLWAGIASPEQARAMIERHWQAGDVLNARWGVRTLASNERMYSTEGNTSNPSNWLGPVWVISNFMTWEGLRRYGFTREAAALAEKTRALLAQDLAQTGMVHECYHPDTGAPNFNGGFLSWNPLVLLMHPDTNFSP
ncbi:MAG: hypothetical protein KIT44_11550 [Opitutaceae bacterium]|nr:hypothetical protein [Opitutaceae bacterium]